MTIKKITNEPTEADLEAEIHAVLAIAFPWLQPGDLKHQTRFSFKFGRSTIEFDGTKVSKAEARSDILIYRGDILRGGQVLKHPTECEPLHGG